MKKAFPILLVLALLCGCGAPQTSPPPAQADETVTYEVATRTLDETYKAADGRELLRVHFEIPELRVLANGETVTEPKTDAQRAALAAAETFNAEFEQWTRSSSLEEDAEMVRELYEENPTAFTQWDEFLTENFSHTVYRRGELICVSAAYYTFLGGPHPNTSFYARNFDLGRGAFFKVPELAEDPQAFTLFVADEIERQAREWIAELFEEEDLDLEDVYWENYREIMESWADYAVAFDDTGMSVTFSAYDLASYAAGPQEFFLSYEELAPFWSESGRQVLGLD